MQGFLNSTLETKDISAQY